LSGENVSVKFYPITLTGIASGMIAESEGDIGKPTDHQIIKSTDQQINKSTNLNNNATFGWK
jgi:hypothetical protein